MPAITIAVGPEPFFGTGCLFCGPVHDETQECFTLVIDLHICWEWAWYDADGERVCYGDMRRGRREDVEAEARRQLLEAVRDREDV